MSCTTMFVGNNATAANDDHNNNNNNIDNDNDNAYLHQKILVINLLSQLFLLICDIILYSICSAIILTALYWDK